MITTEQAFDMLPCVADAFDKLQIKDYIEKNKAKEGDAEVAGYKLVIYIIKNSAKIKTEVFEIVAIAESKKVDEVKKQPITDTIKTFKEILTQDGLLDFFSDAME